MEEKAVKISVLILLFLNGMLDWKKGEISLISLYSFGVLGAIWNLKFGFQDLGELCGGIGLGIGLLAVAFFSREAIGFGDGLLFCVTGIYLGVWGNLRLLLTGTLCCALIQAVGLLFRRVRMKDRVPLVPFLLLAFVGGGFL